MNTEIIEKLNDWNLTIATLSLEDQVVFLVKNIQGKKVFSTSFGIEDQVLTHLLYPFKDNIEFFTLDTGRQFNETYEVFQKTKSKYKNLTINTFFPEETDIQNYVNTNGINGFYDSMESRKKCCFIRKVKPLKRALFNAELWITGLRAEQSQNREAMQFLEWDEDNNVIKFNPLLHYSLEKVKQLVVDHSIPMNTLFQKGYVSIGCAPCTRAIEEGEDFRAGRWWWENGKKECGLHSSQENNN